MIGRAMSMAALAAALCQPALAQAARGFELGFRGGVGQYGYMDDPLRARGVLGVELCAFCDGRYALFGEYSRFLPAGEPSRYKSADLVGAGLRIQGRRRVRPFFDAGVVVGSSRFGSSTFTRTITTGGAEIGGGVTFLAGQHLYIRPQFRLSFMSDLYVAATAQAGIGWRF